uniref:Uncharacterized LOC100175197 n=1 Tax=Ciona intestinalis TaxID=7719 RepID=F6TE87_CIOIN|nr:uncharacterized protein LOC100175197 [Ciona intestinalis]|eukprot:XP_002128511.1 uncharacterized protein LOC100175197 [Ciona intestinalis]
MDDENILLSYAFPETATSDFLVEKLRKHGVDGSMLENIQASHSQLVKCFYQNCASLPRRKPRDNRRGKVTTEKHKKEEKIVATISNVETDKTPSAVQDTQMSEMEKLERRSRLANTKQIEEKKLSTHEPKLRKITMTKAPQDAENPSPAMNSTSPPCVKRTARIKLKRNNCMSPALNACKVKKLSP